MCPFNFYKLCSLALGQADKDAAKVKAVLQFYRYVYIYDESIEIKIVYDKNPQTKMI